jgi:hypothetical protein
MKWWIRSWLMSLLWCDFLLGNWVAYSSEIDLFWVMRFLLWVFWWSCYLSQVWFFKFLHFFVKAGVPSVGSRCSLRFLIKLGESLWSKKNQLQICV